MAAASSSRSRSAQLDNLPNELLDIVTEKVRQECGESFRALECTSKGCFDSVRRCSKILVIKPSKEIEQAVEGASGGSSNARKTPSEKLLEELQKRSGVTRLVFKEPNFLSRGTKFSFSDALSSVAWVGCTITGHSSLRVLEYYCPPFNHPIAWHGSFGQRALSGSGGSLRELSIVSYDVHGSRLAQLARSFADITSFKLDGYVYGSGSFANFNQLVTLDVSNLKLGSERESLARRRIPVVYAPPQPAWPPKVRFLRENAYCTEESSGSILLLGLTVHWRSLPSTLEVLEISWKTYVKKRGCFNGSVSLGWVLSQSDCPLLRRIEVRATPGVPSAARVSKKIRNRFADDVEQIFTACPALEEVVFSGCTGEELMKWIRSFRKTVEVVA